MRKIITVFKHTIDDWHGSYTIDTGFETYLAVEVSFRGNISPPGTPATYRTCVWGTDDCGMEIDCTWESQAWNIFLQIIGMETVTRDALVNLGLVSA